MMNLSMMQRVVETVNEEWKSPLAEKILERWGYDEGQVFYFRASANFLFVFKREGVHYFLRFSDASEKNLALLEAEMEILEYLREQPVKVALPVKSQNDRLIETVETELGTFYAVVFEALPGKQFETEELELEQFFTWGSALGKLHEVIKMMPEQYRLKRESWRDQLSFVQNLLPVEETAARDELNEILNWAERLEVSDDHFGLIHFDFELDNQRWKDGQIGMLDFDDCVNHWYVADIAFALRDLFEDEVDVNNESFQAFISGYKSETKLDFRLLEDLSMFRRMHNLVTFARVLKAVDIAESANHPEWLANLRVKLLNRLDQYRASFSYVR
ncbi:phosphotransferase enzyme family protein [Neobacillus sp. D3-1R]|uniref:phosphotransferase enzyme family protein n=1 Tax=Neobacillus sp. D3-1R TaxID=3445778 RepID=UPI003FA0820F